MRTLHLLSSILRLSVIAAVGILLLNTLPADAVAATQDNWRQCRKCRVMFYNGFPNKGRCPGGRAHLAVGSNFILPHDISETPKAQSAWRFCNRCHVMFFDGYPQKGACGAGGGQFAQGFMFVLPHDVPPRGVVQANWRYCEKCHAMFFDGTADKGRCQSGGVHNAAGYNFVLRYAGNLENDVQLNPVSD